MFWQGWRMLDRKRFKSEWSPQYINGMKTMLGRNSACRNIVIFIAIIYLLVCDDAKTSNSTSGILDKKKPKKFRTDFFSAFQPFLNRNFTFRGTKPR